MPTRDYTIEEIRNRSKYHTVTHVILWQNIPPNIHTLFPNLKNLWLVFMWGDLDLYRYYSYSLLALFISQSLFRNYPKL